MSEAPSISTLYEQDAEPFYPEQLDVFMDGFNREAFLGKLASDSEYWEQRIAFMQDGLRNAEIARKRVEGIASDACHFKQKEPEKFAELPEEQKEVLENLIGRVNDPSESS